MINNQLLQCRITPESAIPPQEFLFNIFGINCFPRGELVAIAGKAKSGKTLFNSMLVTACLKDSVLAIERHSSVSSDEEAQKPPYKVIWYDTEQSEQSTQDILVNRIVPMADVGGRMSDVNQYLYAFNLRCQDWEERKRLFAEGISKLHPDLVILDGVRDLISDINDGVEAQQVTEMLMKLAQVHHCCIACVLHQNKAAEDRNLRGWIGTELTNKVFEVYACEKLRDGAMFKVEQTHSRKRGIGQQLYYTMNDKGLPEACEQPVEQSRDHRGRFVSQKTINGKALNFDLFNPLYLIYHPDQSGNPCEWNLLKLFTDALEGRSIRPFGEVMSKAMKLSKIVDKYYYYERFNEAVERKIIQKVIDPATATQYVSLAEQGLPF
jgi:RecA/RadA recombinase